MAKSARQNALPFRVPLPWNQSKRLIGGGRPSRFRLAASSCHVSPRAASRSLMWPSARFPRLVLGGHPKIIEKLSHNFAATLNFLLVGRSFGRSAYLALRPDRNAIGARRFLCHGISRFHWILRMRTDLPLTGQCLDELDSDFDPTRHRHIESLPLNLDLCASAVQSRWCLAPAFSCSGRATIKACGRNRIGLRLLRTRPRTLWLAVKRDDAAAAADEAARAR